MVRMNRQRWSTVATAVAAPAILIVFGGVFSGGLAASVHGSALPSVQVRGLVVPSVPGHVWGPPALNYAVAPSVNAGPHSSAVGAGTLGAAASVSVTSGASPVGSDVGAFTPMTHCSKMPRIMDLQTH